METLRKNWRIGIDVGGTNTDAVIIDENLKLIASIKTSTTEDVMSGIERSMHAVLSQIGEDRRRIGYAMLGTTHCTNAIVERKNLNKVCVIRLGAPGHYRSQAHGGLAGGHQTGHAGEELYRRRRQRV